MKVTDTVAPDTMTIESTSRKFDLAIMAIRFPIANVDWLFGLSGY